AKGLIKLSVFITIIITTIATLFLFAFQTKIVEVFNIGEISAYLVRPAWANSNGCKSQVRPCSGKHIANSKGVHSDVESEGSFRQTSGLTIRNHIRGNV